MGLLDRIKATSLHDTDETSTLKKKFEEVKNTPLPTRRIVNVCRQSCCGCGCDSTWYHAVIDPGVEIELEEDTYLESWSALDEIATTPGVRVYEDRYTGDSNKWDESNQIRYYV